MASTFHRPSFKHTVSLQQFDMTIADVMKRLQQHHGKSRKTSLLPTMIAIDVDYGSSKELIRTTQRFFKRLRSVHEQYFVRFMVDFLWMAQSDSVDIFYPRDSHKHSRCDLAWTVRAIDGDRLELAMTAPKARTDQIVLYNLSRALVTPIPGQSGMSAQDTYAVMRNLYDRSEAVKRITNLDSDFHILLVPDRLRQNYLPIPIYGMSYDDARRRYARFTADMSYLCHAHDDILAHKILYDTLLSDLIGLIHDTEPHVSRVRSAKEVYGLAELLFALTMGTPENRDESLSHSVVLVDSLNTETDSVNVFTTALRKLAVDA